MIQDKRIFRYSHTHKIDFMVEKDELNWGAKVLDFFGRAATGYCIYQFVAAFRRHGKK